MLGLCITYLNRSLLIPMAQQCFRMNNVSMQFMHAEFDPGAWVSVKLKGTKKYLNDTKMLFCHAVFLYTLSQLS